MKAKFAKFGKAECAIAKIANDIFAQSEIAEAKSGKTKLDEAICVKAETAKATVCTWDMLKINTTTVNE